jgi:hypothetical protein
MHDDGWPTYQRILASSWLDSQNSSRSGGALSKTCRAAGDPSPQLGETATALESIPL